MGMLFATGVQLTMSAGMNYQTGLVVGVSFCVGLLMQTGEFFPDLLPKTFEPIMNNGLVMGGLTAVMLSAAFQMVPKRRASLRLEPHAEQLPILSQFLERQSPAFGLAPSQLNALHLACEEIFIHLCRNPVEGRTPNVIRLQLTAEENHLHVDMEDQSQASDVDAPSNLPEVEKATEVDLDQLGLVILNKVVQEVTHIRVSGFNCISFKIF
jgi:xanthine permease XanP